MSQGVSEGWVEAQKDSAGAHHRTVLPCEELDIFLTKELGVLGGEAWRGVASVEGAGYLGACPENSAGRSLVTPAPSKEASQKASKITCVSTRPRPGRPRPPASLTSLGVLPPGLVQSPFCFRELFPQPGFHFRHFLLQSWGEGAHGVSGSCGSWTPPSTPISLLHTLPVDLLLLGQFLPQTGSLLHALLLALASRFQLQPHTGQGLLGPPQFLLQLLGHLIQLLPLRLPWEGVGSGSLGPLHVLGPSPQPPVCRLCPS